MLMTATKEVAKAARKTVTVVLTELHEHGGKLYGPGEKIEVLPHQKAWLEELGKVAKSTQKEGQ
jgi:hypothetical protein